MTRRHFLKSLALIGLATFVPAIAMPAKRPTPRFVKDLRVGEEFSYGVWGRYRKLSDGWYTKQFRLQKGKSKTGNCPILNGDADVIRLHDCQLSWMGPEVPINEMNA